MSKSSTAPWTRPAARWVIPGRSEGAVANLQKQLNIARVAAEVLVNRGYPTPETAREFLAPHLAPLHDPFQLRDMLPAVVRLEKAIASRERILVYGDYDVDGTASIVVLKKAIEIL